MPNSDFTKDIHTALETLRAGGTLLYPTDTVWGLGCDATNAEAVEKLFAIKKRKESKSMLVLVHSLAMLERYIEEVPEIAEQLIEVAVDPITIIYDGARNLAPGLVAPDRSVGIRITRDPFCRELCRRLGRPIVSTSANVSGQPAPAIFSEISPAIVQAVDYAVECRRDDTVRHAPSSIIKIKNDGTFKLIR